MVTCSACATVFLVPRVQENADIIDVKAEVINETEPESNKYYEDNDTDYLNDTQQEHFIRMRGPAPQRSYGWGGFDPAQNQGSDTKRIRTFYFEKRYNQGPNCCAFGCFAVVFILGAFFFLLLMALTGR